MAVAAIPIRTKSLTKEAALAYKARWQAVHEADIDEAINTPVKLKLRQLSVLMESAKVFGWSNTSREDDDDEVRERWNHLRRAYGV